MLVEGDLNSPAYGQVENIIAIANHFGAVAQEPIIIVVSVSLIPDWKNSSSYNNAAYLTQKIQFIEKMKGEIQSKVLAPVSSQKIEIRVEDFFNPANLTIAEVGYLQGLQAKGSNADMIKIHAIIRHDNQALNHLQMDSNTQIHDYAGLYAATFGSQNHVDVGLALNASYYDEDYVSAHNKIVYTKTESQFARVLRNVHLTYCMQYRGVPSKDDAIRYEEKTKKNSIYSKDFVVALDKFNMTRPFKRLDNKVIHPANLTDQQCYRLTKFVVTAVNMSWKVPLLPPNLASPGLDFNPVAKLKTLTPIQVRDAQCDYASFCGSLKKFTGNLRLHYYASLSGDGYRKLQEDDKINEFYALHRYDESKILKAIKQQIQEGVDGNQEVLQIIKQALGDDVPDDEILIFIKDTKHRFLEGKEMMRAQLIAISNRDIDCKIIHDFYIYAMQELKESTSHQDRDVARFLVETFKNTPLYNQLTKELFGCTVSELHANPYLPVLRASESASSSSADMRAVTSASFVASSDDIEGSSTGSLSSAMPAWRSAGVEHTLEVARKERQVGTDNDRGDDLSATRYTTTK